jgi:uracil-DNA glycosylase
MLGVLMSNNKLAKLLTDTLPPGSPTLFNPWRDRSTDDEPCNGPDARLARLATHLDCAPKFILCGEAPSHRGCRHSGIAFTSECQLLAGEIPRISPMNHRLTSRPRPYFELSAKIVWEALYALGIEKRTILWNALQMHPHKQGKPHSNRTPTSEEIKKGKPALEKLVRKFRSATVIAVGRKAERSLKSMGVRAEYVRHPARGGATKFRQQLKRLVSG